ncbi:MAG TPA: aminotransferase class V-fold PLP-dependent enzyme [Isosphaeraceae bacterium]|nr:aminotransferase class V-fold PLP-dependent enzyme [Isosphaeraceae bacterium]
MIRSTTAARTSLPCSERQLSGLSAGMLGRTLIYLNNACLTPVPRTVAQAVKDYYDLPPACPLRSKGRTTTRLEERIHEGRDLLRSWLGARFSDEIVYTLNTTASINLLAGSFARKQGAILLTDAEHNSNRLPWLGRRSWS